jgi:hypothetical protein
MAHAVSLFDKAGLLVYHPMDGLYVRWHLRVLADCRMWVFRITGGRHGRSTTDALACWQARPAGSGRWRLYAARVPARRRAGLC